MRHLLAVFAFLLSSGDALAQSTSVMIDDLTTAEVQAAIDAGKTTAIYYVGGTHQNGSATRRETSAAIRLCFPSATAEPF